MRAVRACLRVELRTRWRSWVVLALFIGFAGGVVLTTAAGARRTASAYTRFLRASNAADLLVSPDQTGFPRLYKALDRLPGATVTPAIGYGVAPLRSPEEPILVEAGPDGRLGRFVERPKITAGRRPRASDPFEVLADSTTARHWHLHPGSRLRVRVAARQEELPSRRDPEVTLRVVGIGVTRDNVVSVNALASAPTMLATPAFTRRFGPDHYAFDGAEVTLAPGTSKAAFSAAAQSIARRFPETGGNLQIADEADQAAQVNHAIRPQAVTLAGFELLTALAALFAIGQLLARQVFLVSDDNGALRALGMSRRQLVVSGLAQVGATALVGALIAVVVAIAASPTMPIGPARVAEPHPGVAVDVPVLLVGFVAIIVLSVLCSVWPAWRYTSGTAELGTQSERARRPSLARRWANAAGAPPTMAIGIGHTVEPGRGRTAVPSRSSDRRHRVGRRVDRGRRHVRRQPLAARAHAAPLRPVVGRDDRLAVQPASGRPDRSRAPRAPGRPRVDLRNPYRRQRRPADHPRDRTRCEPGSRDRAHRRRGPSRDQFERGRVRHQDAGAHPPARRPDRHRDDAAAGYASSAARAAADRGAQRLPVLRHGELHPDRARRRRPGDRADARRRQPGATAHRRARARRPGRVTPIRSGGCVPRLRRGHICGVYNQCSITTTSRPTDILNYSRIQGTPAALAAVLAILAIGVVANLLVTSIRRRRHDLAILKTLGIGRRGISATVAWQATTLVGISLLVGLPIGVAIGREIWSGFATGLGIPRDSRTPMLAILLAVPVALVIGNAVAAIPAYIAGKTAPAQILRSE